MTDLSRRDFLGAATSLAVATAIPLPRTGAFSPEAYAPPAIEEKTIAELRAGMESGEFTSHGITQQYLERIASLDRQGPTLRHVLETNPDALAIADSLDAERKAGKTRGPLHGIPVLVKDNIDTADRMTTTAGSLALGQRRCARRAHRRAAARRRCADPRQDQPQRVGELPLDAFVEWLVGTRRPGTQSIRARSNSVGIELGICGRSCVELLRRRRRHGDRRVDHVTGRGVLARWAQADDRTREPQRHHSHRALAGHRRPHCAHGDRRRDSARRTCGRGSARPRHAQHSGRGQAGLHALSRRERPQRRAHRRRAKEVHRIQPRRRRALRDGTRRDEGARRGDRRPGGHRDGRQVRRRGVRGAAVRVQGRSRTPISRRFLPVRARTLDDLIAFNRAHAKEEMPYFGQEIFEQAAKKGHLVSAFL